ncbi:Hcp family type VI secretion system effector [Erwinia sorbitola]|uniref:Type VI secretion system tube protein Hcp n=1 Tax=Erwinia sorbitola TaxID=2681984 RepID=A0ABW9R929_9GAMM|nr:type VI secretion system tube protein Hcp [Erwinia sorbitola]MTD26644.1 type VI secretion system tube protein Hcp [Erwinia sorbitola]
MAQDIFIKISGIEGESQDFAHKGEIDVRRWYWAVSQTSNMHSGSGGGAGKSTVHDLFFDHYIDKTTPTLLQYCLNGKHIPEVILTVRKAGGTPLEYLKIIMQEVIISAVIPVGNNTIRCPREKIGLSFSRVKMDYVLQNAEGNSAGTISMGYDIKSNVTI